MVEPSIHLFREACGATGPLQLNVEGPGPEMRPWIVEPPLVLVGRDAHAQLPLHHEQVQKRHAYLQVIGGRVFCLILPTPPGVPAEGGPDPTTWLERGQAIRIGPVWVRVLEGGQGSSDPQASAWSPLAAQPPGQSALPNVTLEILEGAPQVISWRMDRVLALIGRSSNCKVRLVDASVSLVHGSLLRTPAGVWVIDLLGRGGVAVNGTRVRWACLQDGDRVQVGKFLIRFLCERPTHLPAIAGSRAMAVAAPRGVPGPVPTAGRLPVPTGGDAVLMPSELMPARTDGSDAFLMPLVSQFAQMQQEMFDQFQQGLRMVVQMFSSLHREQMVHIRGELDRLQELTGELNSLKAELGKAPPQAAPAPPAEKPMAAPPPAPAARPEGDRDRRDPSAAWPTPHAEKAASPPKAPVGAAANPPSPPAEQADEDIHLWLSKRIAAVQQERQNRWQKIVGFLMSGRTGENVP